MFKITGYSLGCRVGQKFVHCVQSLLFTPGGLYQWPFNFNGFLGRTQNSNSYGKYRCRPSLLEAVTNVHFFYVGCDILNSDFWGKDVQLYLVCHAPKNKREVPNPPFNEQKHSRYPSMNLNLQALYLSKSKLCLEFAALYQKVYFKIFLN